jgi:hypothetical protein
MQVDKNQDRVHAIMLLIALIAIGVTLVWGWNAVVLLLGIPLVGLGVLFLVLQGIDTLQRRRQRPPV